MPRRAARRRQSFITLAGLLLGVLLNWAPDAAAQKAPLASADGGAQITSEGGNLWAIGNDRVSLTLSINAQGALALSRIARPGTTDTWALGSVGDFSVRAGSKSLIPGQGDFGYRRASTEVVDRAVRLSLVFESSSARLRATRTWACYSGAPAIESWTTYESILTSAPVTIGSISLLELTVTGTAVNWITGLHPVAPDVPAFTRQRGAIAAGLTLAAAGRSTTESLPVIWVDGAAGSLVAGLAWSGSWAISATPAGANGRTSVRASLGTTETAIAPGTRFESPHAFVALAHEGDVSTAMAQYIRTGIRHGRPFSPVVTYNTWYSYGVRLSESSLYDEIAHAADLGAELFVVDAGWYAGGLEEFDYVSGTGRWVPDPERFPDGLRPIADQAHALGMRFGIWMEPESIDLAALPNSGETDAETGDPLPVPDNQVQESWLASSGGRFDPGVASPATGQICLANPLARQWVVDQVSRVIEESGADYLKWDNNSWLNCEREGHGHGLHDGNLAHHLGLYEVLRQLRERFPDLVIENCAQGGNRLDLGMMRYTDTAWMDDATAPSSHVRHNLEGLGTIFPPSYLLSFLTDDPSEPVNDAWDLPASLRSRMPGVLGLSIRGDSLGDGDRETLMSEVARCKTLRDAGIDAPLLLLTPQQGTPDTDGWDAMQLPSPTSGNSVVYIFADPSGSDSTVIRLRALDPEATYLVSMADGSAIGEASGALLMADGIGVSRQPESSATVLVVTRQAPSSEAAIRQP